MPGFMKNSNGWCQLPKTQFSKPLLVLYVGDSETSSNVDQFLGGWVCHTNWFLVELGCDNLGFGSTYINLYSTSSKFCCFKLCFQIFSVDPMISEIKSFLIVQTQRNLPIMVNNAKFLLYVCEVDRLYWQQVNILPPSQTANYCKNINS